ncbi:Nuclear transcription factor Y subunit C-2 [Capsicum baccatum]|uniref:Nuclear transcription factor Y subunit C-2 n=1 Tax=Capsicum baccatum TaxID=33114 RepID=A0A2G2X989_CAPBA|nr:Nuclear transcription factor Y subunit C-2 [Capsicum baccatum]
MKDNEDVCKKKDIAKAIERTELFDFLVDIIYKDEIREEGAGLGDGFGPSMLGSTSSDVQNACPPMRQTAPSEVMIRGTASSGVQNFNPSMGQTAPSEVMIRSTAKPRVYPFACAHPQAWQDAEDKTTTSGDSSAQGISMIKGSLVIKFVKLLYSIFVKGGNFLLFS